MTGGAQTWVHASFPGARFVGQGVAYVCACGRTVVGKSRNKKEQKERTIANYACSSYEQVRPPPLHPAPAAWSSLLAAHGIHCVQADAA